MKTMSFMLLTRLLLLPRLTVVLNFEMVLFALLLWPLLCGVAACLWPMTCLGEICTGESTCILWPIGVATVGLSIELFIE